MAIFVSRVEISASTETTTHRQPKLARPPSRSRDDSKEDNGPSCRMRKFQPLSRMSFADVSARHQLNGKELNWRGVIDYSVRLSVPAKASLRKSLITNYTFGKTLETGSSLPKCEELSSLGSCLRRWDRRGRSENPRALVQTVPPRPPRPVLERPGSD